MSKYYKAFKFLKDKAGTITGVAPDLKKTVKETKSDEYIKRIDKLDSAQKKVTEGKKYIKIVHDKCVWGFIVKENFKHFLKGDILKPAGFNAPTLNKARGNIFHMDNLSVRWTGANYLR